MSNHDDLLWEYNLLDCVRTRECGEKEEESIAKLGLKEQENLQQRLFWPILEAMKLGVKVNLERRQALAAELKEEIAKRESYFKEVLGHPLNPNSPSQMCKLFYEDLKQPKVMARGVGGMPGHLTCNNEALTKIAIKEPILRPLIQRLSEYRSLRVFLSTFVEMPLDEDGRMRTSYNICGTETFRLSSSENAFGTGGNLQNIPKGGEEANSDLVLPNVRKLFVPDEGMTMFDTDLSKADLRVVAWESDAKDLKQMLREGRDPYVESAREFYHDPTIGKKNPNGTENYKYHIFKSFSHGSDYGGTPNGLARRLGLTVKEAEHTQRWYFSRYPEILQWQKRTIEQVKTRHFVQNIFGYRRYYFDRIDQTIFNQALAWIGQSTTAIYINKVWLNLWDKHRDIQILMQVHDSLVGQFATSRKAECLDAILEAGRIPLPFPNDPLIIPMAVQSSEVSWGDVR